MPTATKNETVTFFAQRPRQVLVKDPLDHERNYRGQVIKTLPRSAVEFGKDGGDPHLFETSDPELIKWLRSHDKFEALDGGFWELGNAPDEPKPALAVQLETVARAAAEGDLDAIREVIDTEKATHNREPVFAAAKGALKGIEGSSKEK